jgi:hypothetical protein
VKAESSPVIETALAPVVFLQRVETRTGPDDAHDLEIILAAIEREGNDLSGNRFECVAERNGPASMNRGQRPDARRDRTTCDGPCRCGAPRNGLFTLGVILGRIGCLGSRRLVR